MYDILIDLIVTILPAIPGEMQGLQVDRDTEQSEVLPWSVHVTGSHIFFLSHYSIGCAYKRGVCAICGKMVLDTTGYVMSSK